MISKLQWYNDDKPCFYSFKGEGREHRGNREDGEEKGRRRNKKIPPVLGPALIWPMEGGWGPGPGGVPPLR